MHISDQGMRVCFSQKAVSVSLSSLIESLPHHTPDHTEGIHEANIPSFVVYNAHFFAQIFKGKIRMHIIHG